MLHSYQKLWRPKARLRLVDCVRSAAHRKGPTVRAYGTHRGYGHHHLAACVAAIQSPAAVPETRLIPSVKRNIIAHSLAQDASTSDVERIGKYIKECWCKFSKFIRNQWMMLYRSLYLLLVFSPPIAMSPALLIATENSALGKLWWEILRNSIRYAGPCCIKFSQWIATRPDLFPLCLCDNLRDLQSSAHITKDEEVFATLSREFKGKWQDKLSIVYCEKGEMKVLGSGCVATVVKGTLRDDKDTPVAVKILHRGIQRAIDVDIDIMTLWASLVELLPGAKTLSLTESISEFSHFMKRQLDMQLEAESLEIFRKNFNLANSHNPRVHFPAPVRGLITENVLVESYIEGQLASTLFDADEATRKEVAKLGLSALLKMVFEDNYIHGDLHPGNVLVSLRGDHALPSSSRASNSKTIDVTFIDTGLVASLEPNDRRNFIDLFSAVVKNDGYRVGQLMVERSRGGVDGVRNPEAFYKELESIVSEVHDAGLSLKRISVGDILQRVLVACYVNQVKLEPKFVSVAIAIGVVEGLGRRLDPNVDILKIATPFILKAALKS